LGVDENFPCLIISIHFAAFLLWSKFLMMLTDYLGEQAN
jgi:hypothetical protein